MGPSPAIRKIDYKVTAGGLTMSTGADNAAALLSLRVERGMDGGPGQACLRLHPFDLSLPSPGDPLKVELDGGEGMFTVFTGTLLQVRSSAQGLELLATDSLSGAAQQEVVGIFEEQSAGAIIQDILGKTGGKAGEVEEGPVFGRLVLHRGLRALQHLRGLARLSGLDFWTDGEGKVMVKAPKVAAAKQTLTWGEGLLELDLCRAAPAPDGWELWGEGAAGSAGKEKAHWLAADLSGVSGKASVKLEKGSFTVEEGSAGKMPKHLSSGLLRSGEVAESLAKAQAQARAGRPVRGHLELTGAPDLEPGMAVAVAGLPDGHAATGLCKDPLRIRRIQHRLDADGGYMTRLVL